MIIKMELKHTKGNDKMRAEVWRRVKKIGSPHTGTGKNENPVY